MFQEHFSEFFRILLGDKTPISLLNTTEGLARVQDTLGRVEHGVW
jgi:uncharacterized protein (DUF2384 family)